MKKKLYGLITCSARFEEDLDGVIETFDTLRELCDLSEEEKGKEIAFILKGNAFRMYAKKSRIITYSEGISLLRGWYKSEEKQPRLINQWSKTRLSETLEKKPEM